jgi:hypothetical protein
MICVPKVWRRSSEHSNRRLTVSFPPSPHNRSVLRIMGFLRQRPLVDDDQRMHWLLRKQFSQNGHIEDIARSSGAFILAVISIRKEPPMVEYREPTLDELLTEPMIRQVMASDGVDSDEIRALMSRMHSRQFWIMRPQLSLGDLVAAKHRSQGISSSQAMGG